MSYARQDGESVEQYVDRIRQEAANGTISSGPGGTFIQNAIDQARGFGGGSGGKPENRSQSVSDQYFAGANAGQGPFALANANQPLSFNGGSGGSMSSLFATQGASNNPVAGTPSNVTSANQQTPGAATPLTPGMDQNEFEKARQSILYNLQNPEFAMQNALREKGLSLYNPIIRRGILPLAQTLGTAYTVHGAEDPNAGPQTDVASGFRNFIGSALSGANGGIRGAASSALGGLGNLGNTLWNAANAQQAGQVPNNPFIGALLSTLYDPQALMGMQTGLSLPFLGPGLTSGLNELLGLKAANAWNQIQPNENFYKYLVG